jgi:hypothetical protein
LIAFLKYHHYIDFKMKKELIVNFIFFRFDQIETENARLRFQLQENEAQREKLMRTGKNNIYFLFVKKTLTD